MLNAIPAESVERLLISPGYSKILGSRCNYVSLTRTIRLLYLAENNRVGEAVNLLRNEDSDYGDRIEARLTPLGNKYLENKNS